MHSLLSTAFGKIIRMRGYPPNAISRELRSAAALERFRTRDVQRATGAKTIQGLVHQHPKGWGVQALVKDNYRQNNKKQLVEIQAPSLWRF